jgi:hypothetical protein
VHRSASCSGPSGLLRQSRPPYIIVPVVRETLFLGGRDPPTHEPRSSLERESTNFEVGQHEPRPVYVG